MSENNIKEKELEEIKKTEENTTSTVSIDSPEKSNSSEKSKEWNVEVSKKDSSKWTVEISKDSKDSKTKNQKGNRNNNRNKKFVKRPQEFEEKVVDVARVTTVVKGGRRFSFSVLVVIGDKKGRVGYGHGKANEVPDAIKKAIKDAKRNIINVQIIDGRTIPHEIHSKFISSKIMLKPAPKGKGIIASGAVRSVVELAGYHDIVTKSLGSSNKTNVVKATLKALSELRTIEQIAKLRDIKVSEVLGVGE